MTARRLDLTIAAAGILVLGAAAAGAAGRAWYHALTVPIAADRLAYVDVTVALLALGLLGFYPLSTTILSLISRPATRHSSRRAGPTPVESRRAGRRSGSRRTSRALRRGGARLVRHHAAGGGDLPRSCDPAAAGPQLPARRTRPCSPTVRVTHSAPSRETVGGAR